ncbi:uncharacterized protein [Blastocystis hominis]|uniref:Uncharacterized protein n=1 Tax=Blastocystis hominis TaxID=12968 RepID=D8LYP4_BLAHO|nr:uncharacterized protein [Blastocystis hominis]CBK20699.2 unnamed protein product [Blastocystis hominis]|eukprot:XP_012894747.1 uncharacterized protein [Blastocystis hominis]
MLIPVIRHSTHFGQKTTIPQSHLEIKPTIQLHLSLPLPGYYPRSRVRLFDCSTSEDFFLRLLRFEKLKRRKQQRIQRLKQYTDHCHDCKGIYAPRLLGSLRESGVLE